MRTIIFFLIGCLLMSCAPLPGSQKDARITMIGDSVLAWNRGLGASVGNALADELNAPVANFSVVASRISQPSPAMQFTRLQIDKQLDRRKSDWIVLNGGANDLYFECLCLRCETVVNQLISPDGTVGELPNFLKALRSTGAQIMYVGYHRTGGLKSAYDRCADELGQVEERLRQFVTTHDGIHFADMRRVFPPKDTSFYAGDYIHPSEKGSAAIATRLAAIMREAGYVGG